MYKLTMIVLGGLMLPACSTIVNGSSQDITVNTNPPGADCVFLRKGLEIARVNPTPGTAKIDKTKDDIQIDCTKDQFTKASYFNKSDVNAMTFGNAILGGLIGWGIDSATGSDNKYTSPVNITLVPSTPGSAAEKAVDAEDAKDTAKLLGEAPDK